MIGAPRTPPAQSNGGAPVAPIELEDNSSNSVTPTPKAGDEKKEGGLEQPNGANIQDEARVNPNPNSPPRSPVLRPR